MTGAAAEFSYRIRLCNCAIFARHGVLEEERRLGQRFFVDANLLIVPSGRLEEDSIDHTVDYGEVFKLIERIVTGERHRLIEALALRCARAIVDGFPQVRQAEITVRKPSAPIEGVLDHVEVTLAWPQ